MKVVEVRMLGTGTEVDHDMETKTKDSPPVRHNQLPTPNFFIERLGHLHRN